MKRYLKCKLYYVLWAVCLVATISCKKLVEVDAPNNELVQSAVFESDATATAALMGLYGDINSAGSVFSGGNTGLSALTAISGDELINATTNANFLEYSSNSITSVNSVNTNHWTKLYNYIYQSNSIIEGLEKSSTVSAQVKKQLLGEARFIRAFCNFYLYNLYGDVPLTLTTDYRANSTMGRATKAAVYASMLADLTAADEELNPNYVGANSLASTTERIRVNKYACKALLARVYLYKEDWANAENYASQVISNKTLYDTVSVKSAFLKNNVEALWQMTPTRVGYNTEDGNYFIITRIPSAGLVYLPDNFQDAFEPGDRRFANWVGNITLSGKKYLFPYKYKIAFVSGSTAVSEYHTLLRLSEQYLIRAEARAMNGKLSEALTDINVIRKKAGLPATLAVTLAEIKLAIENERRLELFTEMGHRWFDLKRTGRIDPVLMAAKPSWKTTAQLFPIPQVQIDRFPAMKNQQNPGY